ncbi:MAG: O-antigen ligase family protein, partial [Muribaculaceae bacterium]
MDRILITIVLLTTLIFWLIRNKDNLTYSKLAEILIAFYIFSCAFPRLFLPLYTLNYPFHWGTFDIAFRIQIYLLLIPFFLLIISKRFNWKVQPIKKKYILIILLFIGYTMLNPYDTVKDATLIPVVYLLAYLVFLYLLYSTCTIKTIIKGIYLGFAITIALHFVLAILFPVMNISSAITLFSYDATIRAISRAGAVGTFSHPNSLGVYASYYLMFFLSCVLIKFRTKDSILLSICAFIIIVLTGSRSALISGVVGLMAMICLYIYRQYQIFSPKIFFKGVIPVVIIATILLFFTPISKLFFNSDMDEMALARIMHYICGFEIFKEHPLIGVGLNSHLKYLNDNIDIDFQLLFSTDEWLGKDFMYSDPIHNMWIVILT